jgi:hypothetical protein
MPLRKQKIEYYVASNRIAFQKLARLRLREAKVLLRADCPHGALYLCGYAVECALKACVAKRTGRHDFPDKDRAQKSHTHDIITLIELAGLTKDVNALETTDPPLYKRWQVVIEWSEVRRYGNDPFAAANAAAIIAAIDPRTNGVLKWIRQRW